jgi:Fur family ferric uptake transcriptional regulator
MSPKGATLPCGRPIPTQPESKTYRFEAFRTRLEKFALEKQLNRSEAREKILETIVKESRHFRSLDLLERLSKRYPEVGRATFYRNIPIFVESGILKEGPMDSDGQVFYELCEADEDLHHDHIVCMDCQKIFEFHDEEIEMKQAQISKKMGFNAQKHTHVIYAKCEYLSKAQ